MESENQIFLISETCSLKINFERMFDVKNKKIALLGFQSPDIQPDDDEDNKRYKRIPKDSYFVGNTLSVFVHCDKVKENVFVNKLYSSNSSLSMKCLDIIQLTAGRGYNSIEVQNPKYHALNTNSLFSLEIELCNVHGSPVNFNPGYIVVKLGIK